MDSEGRGRGKGSPPSHLRPPYRCRVRFRVPRLSLQPRATARATSAGVADAEARWPRSRRCGISWMPAASMSARFASCASGLREEVASSQDGHVEAERQTVSKPSSARSWAWWCRRARWCRCPVRAAGRPDRCRRRPTSSASRRRARQGRRQPSGGHSRLIGSAGRAAGPPSAHAPSVRSSTSLLSAAQARHVEDGEAVGPAAARAWAQEERWRRRRRCTGARRHR